MSKFQTADLVHDEDLQEEHYVKKASNQSGQTGRALTDIPVCIICMEQIPLHHTHGLEVTEAPPSQSKDGHGCQLEGGVIKILYCQSKSK